MNGMGFFLSVVMILDQMAPDTLLWVVQNCPAVLRELVQ